MLSQLEKFLSIKHQNETNDEAINRVLDFYILNHQVNNEKKIDLKIEQNDSIQEIKHSIKQVYNVFEEVIEQSPKSEFFELLAVKEILTYNPSPMIDLIKSAKTINQDIISIRNRVIHCIANDNKKKFKNVYINENEISGINNAEQLLDIAISKIYSISLQQQISEILLCSISHKNLPNHVESLYVKGLFKQKYQKNSEHAFFQIIELCSFFELNIFFDVENSKKQDYYPSYHLYLDLRKLDRKLLSNDISLFHNFDKKINREDVINKTFSFVTFNDKTFDLFNANWAQITAFVLREAYSLFGEDIFSYENKIAYPAKHLNYFTTDSEYFVEFSGHGSLNCMNILKKLVATTGMPILIQLKDQNGKSTQFDLHANKLTFHKSHQRKQVFFDQHKI